MSPDGSFSKYGLKGNEIVGFAVSFPASETAEPIEYKANYIYMNEF